MRPAPVRIALGFVGEGGSSFRAAAVTLARVNGVVGDKAIWSAAHRATCGVDTLVPFMLTRAPLFEPALRTPDKTTLSSLTAEASGPDRRNPFRVGPPAEYAAISQSDLT